MKKITILTTFFNEENVIAHFIERVQGALKDVPYNYEIILVNDDSEDQSQEIIQNLMAADPHIKLVNMARRFGVYECLTAGLRQASGDAVIYLDADLQDPPELIPKLLEEWDKGADVVYTVRSHRFGETFSKRLLTKIAYGVVNFFSEVNLDIEAGDYRLLSRKALDTVLLFDEPSPYFRGQSSWIGLKRSHVFYEREARLGGASKRGLLSGAPLRVFFDAITSFSLKPLGFSAASCLLGGAIAFVSALFVLILDGVDGQLNVNWVVALFFFLFSLLSISVAVVSLYLIRITQLVRRRPQYVIDNVLEAADENE